VAAAVFSTAFSVSFCAPFTVFAQAPLSAATITRAQRPAQFLLTFVLLGKVSTT
jgi:hypothetical protein